MAGITNNKTTSTSFGAIQLTDLSSTGPLPPSALKAIGIGPSYPFAFAGNGSIKTVQVTRGTDKINQSIHVILTTRPGERVMNPEFGSRIPDLVFEPMDMRLQDLLYIYTIDALQRWEQRISIVAVTFPADIQDEDNSLTRMRILYNIRQTNVVGSYVFPFQRFPMPMASVVQGKPVPAPNAGAATNASPFLLGSNIDSVG